MMSKRSLEGYLLIDHSASPGTVGVPEGSVFEGATLTCSHCERQVVVHPLRTRERAWCPKCDHYVCDECEAARVASGGECLPFKVRLEKISERISRGLPYEDLRL